MSPTLMLSQVDTTDPVTMGLTLMVVGMLIVFVALVLLMAVIRLIDMATAGSAPATEPAAAPKPVAPVEEEGVNEELLVVLAAAATAALRRSVRVRRVRLVKRSDGSWVAGGRQGIMTSHRPHLRRSNPHRR